MDKLMVILIVLIMILLILGLFVYIITKKKSINPDYYAIYLMGLIWFPMGVIIQNHALWILGLTFFIIGFANKEKWGKCDKISEVTKDAKKLKIIVIVLILVIMLFGFLFHLFRESLI